MFATCGLEFAKKKTKKKKKKKKKWKGNVRKLFL